MQPLSLEDQNKPPEPVIQLSPRRWLVLRLVFACLFGAVIMLLSLVAGYRTALISHTVSPQLKTQDIIGTRMGDVERYREKHHVLPHTLSQFGSLKDLDAWNHPLVYTVHRTNFSIASYGQDGKPGGTGWDADISSANLFPTNGRLTYTAFLYGDYTETTVQGVCVTGVLAALLCFVTVRSQPVTRRNLQLLIIRVALVLMASIYIGGSMAVMELPIAGPWQVSGH